MEFKHGDRVQGEGIRIALESGYTIMDSVLPKSTRYLIYNGNVFYRYSDKYKNIESIYTVQDLINSNRIFIVCSSQIKQKNENSK